MVEEILSTISQLTPLWIYAALFLFSFIENVFPPSPSDIVVVIGGSLISTGVIGFIPTLIITSIGSVTGFMTLFYLGSIIDKKIIHSGRLRFISVKGVDKAEAWFNKYGYTIIAINRFLPGTRSVISLFAGMSKLNFKKTILLATLSALLWNSIIIYLGMIFGNNVERVDYYLSQYQNIAIALTVLVAAIFIINFFRKKKKGNNEEKK
jgi:membrane protein DedA with SNARE-associated domain